MNYIRIQALLNTSLYMTLVIYINNIYDVSHAYEQEIIKAIIIFNLILLIIKEERHISCFIFCYCSMLNTMILDRMSFALDYNGERIVLIIFRERSPE